MTGQNRGGKKKTKQRKEKSKRKSVHVEEQYLEDVTGNDEEFGHRNESGHPPAHENETDHQSASSEESQPLPPDELYFKNTEFTQKCKIQSKCYVSKTVQILKKPKFKPELEWFENHPQFNHFFHMPDEPNLKLLGMWMLLLRTIPLHEGEETSWFAVNGVPIRYSLREHALISGLDCRAYPPKYKKIGSFAFVDRHFNKRSEITMTSVKEKLVSMSACGDRLRMAVLYSLGTIIRAKARYNAPFDSFILRVANDVELTKTFPWGRLTFDDALGSISHVMKLLKGKPKKNVNFPGFIIPLEVLAFECIPALNAEFREDVDGCLSKCPRMCKRRFQSNSMKGFPLEDLYHTLGTTNDIKSVLVPNVNEEPLMASITEKEPDYENEEGVSNLWSTWLTVKEKPIFWQELYELDVAAREFTDKKGKGPRVEEASSCNHGLEDVLKGFEERLMGSLSEVCVTVNKMDTRLGVIEKSHKILKRRFKKMKVEKRLTSLEEYQRRLIKGAKKQKAIEERLDGIEKDMKRKENENENNEGFEYQNTDFDWDLGRSNEKGEEEKAEEEVEAELRVETEEVEAYKEPEVEEEGGVEVETEPRVDAEQDKEKQKGEETMNEGNEMGRETRVETEEVEAYKEPEVEEEGGVEMETEPPRGRTKAAAAYMGRGSRTVSLKWDDEVSAVDETALSGKDKQGWILTVFKSKDGASAVDETAPAVEQTEQGAPAVDETPADVDETPAAVEQTEQGASAKETNEPATDKGAEGAENDPKPRGRPRKSTDPKKFTTPKQRTRTRSQWISSPYTEADTNEIEGRKKKKPRTEA